MWRPAAHKHLFPANMMEASVEQWTHTATAEWDIQQHLESLHKLLH